MPIGQAFYTIKCIFSPKPWFSWNTHKLWNRKTRKKTTIHMLKIETTIYRRCSLVDYKKKQRSLTSRGTDQVFAKCYWPHFINEVVQVVHSTLSMKLYKLYIVPLYIPLYHWSCTTYIPLYHEVVQVVHSILSIWVD